MNPEGLAEGQLGNSFIKLLNFMIGPIFCLHYKGIQNYQNRTTVTRTGDLMF